MILRRPFALLIKYFRLIHVILSVFISYLVFKTSAMLSFITDYSVLPTNLVDPKVTKSLFPIWVYIVPAFLIIGYVVIMVLMKFKEKPITFYFTSIASMIFTIIVYTYANQTVTELEIALIDVRTLKLNQDLIRTAQIVQFIITIITIVRATGFNIKKFNFTKDLETLAIEEADNEEFEVNLEVDGDSFKKKWRHFKRNAKYVLVENKIMIIVGVFLAVIVVGIAVYLNKFVYHKVYKFGELIEASDFYFNFKESYKTFYDYKENMEQNTAYVIVRFDVRKKYGKDVKLETMRLALNINGHSFYHNKKAESKFFDLGKVYKNEEIGSNMTTYNLIFEIPNIFIEDDMYLIYEESAGKQKKIKTIPKNLNAPQKEIRFNMKDTIDFKDSTLKRSTLTIQNFVLNDTYKNTYQFCALENICYESAEYIIPTFTDNYDKTLMKLEAEFIIDDTLNIKELNGFISFLNNFAKLHYKVGNEEKIEDKFTIVVPKNTNYQNIYYIEANKEIKEASEIWFEITVRDKKYNYYLK